MVRSNEFAICNFKFSISTYSLLIALLAVCVLAGGARATPEGAILADAEYAVEAADRFATVTLDLKILSRGDGWHAVPLIPWSVALRSFKVHGKRGYIEQRDEHYVAHILGKDEYRVELQFVIDVKKRGAERSIELPLARSASSRVRFAYEKDGYAVTVAPEMPVERAAETGRTVAMIFPTDVDRLTIRWLPEELEKERAAVFEAHEESLITLVGGSTAGCMLAGELPNRAPNRAADADMRAVGLPPGGVKRRTRFTLDVRRGELDAVSIAIPTGVDVLAVRSAAEQGRGGLRIADCGLQISDWPLRNPKSAIGSPVQLSTFKPSPGEPAIVHGWRVEGEDPERRLRVRLAQPLSGKFRLDVISEQVGRETPEGLIRILPFRVEAAARQTGVMAVQEAASATIVDAGSVGVRRAAAALSPPPDSLTRADKPVALAFEYHKLPAELRLRLSPLRPRVTAVTESHARLQAGIVELETRIVYRIEKAPVERLLIGLDEGLIVLGVAGDGVETWTASDDRVEVRLKRPVKGDYALTLKCLQNLRRMNGVLIPRVRCMDAERKAGSIGVSAGEDVVLVHHHAEKVMQVDINDLPEWVRARQPKLAYVYDQPDGVLAVSTGIVKPALRVEGYAIAKVAQDAVQEEVIFVCTVEKRPVFSFRLRLPEGLTPINLLGDAVADWEYHPASRSLLVSLDRPCLGSTRLHLFGERRPEPETPEIALGGVAVLDADQTSGWFGIGTRENLELVPGAIRGMSAADIKDTPPLVSTYGDLRLAYQWTGEQWGMTCVRRPVLPRIEAETRTALLFSAGSMQTQTDVVWRISKATVGEFLIALPEGAVNSQVTGSNIRSQELVDDVWRVRLNDPVKGDCQMRVTFDQLPDRETGEMRYTGVRLPQAERQTGAIGAYLKDPQLGVTVGEMTNATRTDAAPVEGLWAERPDVGMGDYPFLGAFGYGDANRVILFTMKGHAIARGVQLNAETCRIATVVKEEGEAVSYMSCRLRNAGAQFFSMRLPEGAKLWGAYVQGEPVRPNRVATGEILVPILEAPRDRAFDLGVIWSERPKKLGFGSELALTSPKLDLPAEAVYWDVFLPEDYQVVRTTGNMKLLQRRVWYQQGLPGIAWRYARHVWRPLKAALKILAWIVGIGLVASAFYVALRRAVRAWRRRRAAAAEEPRRRPAFSWVTALVVLLVLGLLAGLLLPAFRSARQKAGLPRWSLARAREEGRRSVSKENLSQIGKAIFAYTQNNNERMPDSLDELYPKYISSLNVYRCPSTEDETYVYAGPIDPREAKPDTPIAWSPPGAYENGQNVLYFDGHVRWREFPTQHVKADVSGRRSRDIGVTQRALSAGEEAAAPEPPAESERLELRKQLLSPATESEKRLAAKEAAQQKTKLEFARRDRYRDAMQLAEAHRKRGEYDQAEEQLRRAQRNAPASKEVAAKIDRLSQLKQVAPQAAPQPADRLEGPAGAAATPPARMDGRRTETYGGAALFTLSDKLKDQGGEDWVEEVAVTDEESGLLGLVTGKDKKLSLRHGGAVTVADGELIVEGTDQEIREVREAAARLRGAMLEKSREITRARQKQQEELAARKRAEFKRIAMAAKVKPRLTGGTISGSRGAGAMPIELSFPSAGTIAYPFHMDYAGASQARIGMTCLRASTAVVTQAMIGIIVLMVVATLSWRRIKLGLPLAVVLAFVLIFSLRIGDEALKQYVVMALAGLILAAPVLLARLATLARRAAEHK